MHSDTALAPLSSVYYKDEVELGSQNTLICYITRFYPPQITVSWTRNDVNVMDEATLSRHYPTTVGTFNMMSRLSFTPAEGDIHTCMVEHAALDRPLTRTWDVQVALPGMGPSVFCGVGLAGGLMGLVVGTFFIVKGNTYGYFFYGVGECVSSSPDLTDTEYICKIYFNKELSIQFNSTVGKFIGFNEIGMSSADSWNSGKDLLVQRSLRDLLCKPGFEIMYTHFLDKTVQPKIRLRSEQEARGDHPAILLCSAYDFYPPAIEVYWLRDGEKVTTDVVYTEEMADGDWYYQIHSHLEYTPKSGEKISCVVEHVSFSEPIIYDWDPYPESERSKIAIGASGLVLGIILSAAGFIYYKKKSSGQTESVQQTLTSLEYQDLHFIGSNMIHVFNRVDPRADLSDLQASLQQLDLE
ncbi:hypothetical protein NFI96_019618, partial [Prochilodus magdalenae]